MTGLAKDIIYESTGNNVNQMYIYSYFTISDIPCILKVRLPRSPKTTFP